MQQTIFSWQQINKCTKFDDFTDFAAVCLSNFNISNQDFNLTLRFIKCIFVWGEQLHNTCIIDIN